MKTVYPQLSEWSVTCDTVFERSNSAVLNKENHVDSHKPSSNINEQNSESNVTIKSRLGRISSQRCSSLSFCQGLILGILTAGLILAVVTALWLTSVSRKTTRSNSGTGTNNISTTSNNTASITISTTTSTSTTSSTTTSTSTTSRTTTSTSTTVSTTTSTSTTSRTTTSTSTTVSTTTSTSTTSRTTTSTSTTVSTTTSTSTTDSTTTGTATISNICIGGASYTTMLLYLSLTSTLSWTQYSFNYTSLNVNSATLMFAMRNDPAYWYLDDVSVTNSFGIELLSNGGFEQGTLSGWTYCNPNSAMYSGSITSTTSHSGSYSYGDGSVNAADYLSQTFAVLPNNEYSVSFWLSATSSSSSIASVTIIS